MVADMKNFQFTVPMLADSRASSYPRYVQLAFPNGMMFVFETFTTAPEDWTALFSLVDGKHTLIVSFDGANNWAGIYALLGTQLRTDHQKKNKEAIQFFNNPSTSFLQSDVLAYATLNAYYPLLLFLAFSHYGFIPEVYNAPALFPHDSLDAAKIDHLAETIIAAFHNVALLDVLLPNCADQRQSLDSYDSSEAAHYPESAQEEEKEA
uniref:Uncharacterized protein n=1 Tax=Romanomermis culicivorax TaxID=13658 RepID=A0A915JN16_ROMCU